MDILNYSTKEKERENIEIDSFAIYDFVHNYYSFS